MIGLRLHVRAARQLSLVFSFCAPLIGGSARSARSQSQLYTYPAKGQNQQQDKGRYEGHTGAAQQTGTEGLLWERSAVQSAEMYPRVLRLAPKSASWRADFGAETSADRKPLRNNSNKLRPRPPFQRAMVAVCKSARVQVK